MFTKEQRTKILKAFRQRLLRHGYTDVHLNCFYSHEFGNYRVIVSCRSPDNDVIDRNISLFTANALPRIVFFE